MSLVSDMNLVSPIRVLCLLIAALLAAAPAIPRDVTGTLEGTVVGLDDKPVASARVIIQESGNGDHPHAALTTVNGRFSFQRLLPGPYDVRAAYLGVWSPWERNARVQTGKTANVTLRIPASPSKDLPAKDGSPGTGSHSPSGF